MKVKVSDLDFADHCLDDRLPEGQLDADHLPHDHGPTAGDHDEVIWEMAQEVIAGRVLPPIKVVKSYAGHYAKWIVVDGNHRAQATALAGAEYVDAVEVES